MSFHESTGKMNSVTIKRNFYFFACVVEVPILSSAFALSFLYFLNTSSF